MYCSSRLGCFGKSTTRLTTPPNTQSNKDTNHNCSMYSGSTSNGASQKTTQAIKKALKSPRTLDTNNADKAFPKSTLYRLCTIQLDTNSPTGPGTAVFNKCPTINSAVIKKGLARFFSSGANSDLHRIATVGKPKDNNTSATTNLEGSI